MEKFKNLLLNACFFGSSKHAQKIDVKPRHVVPKGWGFPMDKTLYTVASPEQSDDPQSVDPVDNVGEPVSSGLAVGEVYVFDNDQSELEQNMEVGTVKLLRIAKGKKLSTHFHKEKSEIFYVISGKVTVELTYKNSTKEKVVMSPDDFIYIPVCLVHSISALDDSVILEVSTIDSPNDSYRVVKGD